MRRPSAIVLSLALNALLLVAFVWRGRPSAGRMAALPADNAPAHAGVSAATLRSASAGSTAVEASTPAFDWSQLPTEPW